jgi:4-amino-4-deoxy-L-arabinose transferase-like glycosyltransferase
LDYISLLRPARPIGDLWVILLLILAAALRVGWVWHLSTAAPPLSALPDQVEYLELASNLRDGNGLSFQDPRLADRLYGYRMPGYPAFLALFSGNLLAIRLTQALLDASAVLAVYWLARRWGGLGAARLAAGAIAFNPFLIYFCGLILSETLFSGMLIWGMTLLALSRRPIGWIVGIGLLIASIYVRPSAIALPLILGLCGALVNPANRRPYDWKWSPPVGTLVIALTVLALLPWAWRNKRALGAWIWTTTNGGITLYDGFNPDATGASDQRFVAKMPQLQKMDEVDRDRYFTAAARRFIHDNPRRVAELTLLKIARTWSPMPLSDEYGRDPRLVGVSLAYMVPFYLLILAGLWLAPAPRTVKAFLMAPAVYFTLVHAASVGSLRYRIPADVPMAVIAGFAASRPGRSRAVANVPLPETSAAVR